MALGTTVAPARQIGTQSGSGVPRRFAHAIVLFVGIGLLPCITYVAAPGRVLAETGLGPAPAAPDGGLAAVQPIRRTELDLLIFEIRLGSFILSEAMTGYLTPSGLLLPLGDLARAIEFLIAVEPESGTADGWFLSEDRMFSLDVARREAIVEGRRASYPATLVEPHEDDIYVDTRLLSQWFPLDIGFDLPNLSVTITSREPLPVEQRLEREQRHARALSQRLHEEETYPRLDTPYKFGDWPFIDTSIEAGFRQDAEGKSTKSARYSSLLAGDLLYMNSKLFVTGNDSDRFTDARVELGRSDPDGELLGPLQATAFGLGDVSGPQLALVSRSKFGRGAVLSTFPLDRPSEFDRITIRGELPLGWEAELYRNEVLLEFQRSRDDGRYEFTDVPLLFGLNVLRVALYGPQGQRRQDVRRVLVGPGLVQPGEFSMQIAASQQDEDLLPVEDDAVQDDNDLKGRGRFLAEVERGISGDLSVGASLSSLPFEDERRHYGGLNVRGVLGSVYSRVDAVSDSTGGWAANAAVQARFPHNLSLSVEHGEFRDFVSEQVTDTVDLLRSRSKLRLDGVVAPAISLRVPFAVEGRLDRTESGRTKIELSNRLSTSLAGASFSNDLTADLDRGNGGNSTVVRGDVLVGGWLGDVSLRGGLGYDLVPESELTEASLTGEWFIDRDFSSRLGVNRRLAPPSETTFTVGLSRIFESFSLGFNADGRDDGNFGARLTMSFGLGHEPRTNDWRIGPRALADSGAVSARVFLDNNTNQRFDEGDSPLEGVEFIADQGLGKRVKSDSEGIAFLTGLTPYRRSAVAVDESSLEDPYWTPQTRGRSVVPRPGRVAVAEFPIVATGEIDGTVYQRIGGATHEVSDVAIQLVDQNGEVVKTVRSAFDGFYLLDFVPPGRYRIQIDPEQMARLNLMPPTPVDIVLGGSGDVIAGQDLLISSAPNPGDATAIAEAPTDGPDVAEPGAAAPERTDVAEPAATATERPEAIAAAKTPAAAPAAADTSTESVYWVQVGAYRDRVLGQATWRNLQKTHGALLKGAGETMLRSDLGPRKGVWYYFRVGPFPVMIDAERLCADLKATGVDCFPLKARTRLAAGGGPTAIAPATGPSRPPSFQAMRFTAEGEAIVSGVAPAHWDVIVLAGAAQVGQVGADAKGRWSWIPERGFAPGAHRLRLVARGPEGQTFASGTDLLVVVPEPGGAAGPAGRDRRPVTLTVPQNGAGPVRVLPGADVASESGARVAKLSIETVEYDTEGRIRIAGRAPAGAVLRAVLGNETAGPATAGEDGHWRLALQHRPEPGPVTLAIEHVVASGDVVGRAEAVLDYTVSSVPAEPPERITVKVGDNLWRISRSVYGRGVLHTIIQGFNSNSIEDPDRIRPKQEFVVPGAR